MAIWVVAVEYAGPDIEPHRPAPRRPLLEHAYDVETGLLAHGGPPVRVGFDHPPRGWPAAPQRVRCLACTRAVATVITGVVMEIVERTVAELTRWATRFIDRVDDDVLLWDSPREP